MTTSIDPVPVPSPLPPGLVPRARRARRAERAPTPSDLPASAPSPVPTSVGARPRAPSRRLGDFTFPEGSPEAVAADALLEGYVVQARATPGGYVSVKVSMTLPVAEAIVRRNLLNRDLIPALCTKYARDMLAKNWDFNGEPIVFDWDGVVITGQHRAYGLMEAAETDPGVRVEVALAFGIDPAARRSTDQGTPLGKNQTIGFDLPNRNNVMAIADLIFQYRHRGMISRAHADKATRAELVATLQCNPDVPECLRLMSRRFVGLVGGRSTFGFALWLLSRTNTRDEAYAFLAAVIDGDGLARGTPGLSCRNRLLRDDKAVSTVPLRIELIVRAWGAHREGRTNTTLLALKGEIPSVHGSLVDPGAGKPSYGWSPDAVRAA